VAGVGFYYMYVGEHTPAPLKRGTYFYFLLNKLKKATTLKIMVTTKNMLTHMRFLF